MEREAPVTAVLGPTNTGKTHYAIERMLGRASGVIGLPLRLLAREVYDRVVKAKGPAAAALVTGEEKIVPKSARYFICTVEAMPLDKRFAFLAVDEIQLCADPERGHIFTERLLHARGSEETLFLGSATMGPVIRRLIPEARHIHRERFSKLSYAGAKKLSKLPRRSAIVAFSAEDVYAIAELIRRQRGGAAVVMGALSPRTRNAQVDLYQSGEVDYLIATNAIGMGLNMDVDHVAFAGFSKFDGKRRRRLRPDEIGQIAGRAGRFRDDGAFGETADARPLDAETIEAVEGHDFDPVRKLYWRNHDLDRSNLAALRNGLNAPPSAKGLERVRDASDEAVLDILSRDEAIADMARSRGGTARLWDVCRTPDFRKSTLDEHARLIKQVYTYRMTGDGTLPEAWLASQIDRLNKTTGDVDVLAQRLAHVRTWAYAANRAGWTADPERWRARARAVEDALSDALHERLTARFIDRRTSALVRGLRDKAELAAGLSAAGEVTVEGHFVGKLEGLRLRADATGRQLAARAVQNAAAKAARPEINRRLGRIARAEDAAFTLTDEARILWEGADIARLAPSSDPFAARAVLLGGELGAGEAIARAERRLERFAAAEAERALGPFLDLRRAVGGGVKAPALDGLARGIAYRLVERFGAAPRADLAADIDALSSGERRKLRAAGVKIGAHSVFMPALLQPAAARLLRLFNGVHRGESETCFNPPADALSLPREPHRAACEYAAAGYRLCGPLAVRLDALERLEDRLRRARQGPGRRGFPLTSAMAEAIGADDAMLRAVLKSLGYKRVRKAVSAGAGALEQPELWARRSKRPAPAGEHAQAPAPADNPFAELAALKTQAPRRRPRKRRPSDRRARGEQAG